MLLASGVCPRSRWLSWLGRALFSPPGEQAKRQLVAFPGARPEKGEKNSPPLFPIPLASIPFFGSCSLQSISYFYCLIGSRFWWWLDDGEIASKSKNGSAHTWPFPVVCVFVCGVRLQNCPSRGSVLSPMHCLERRLYYSWPIDGQSCCYRYWSIVRLDERDSSYGQASGTRQMSVGSMDSSRLAEGVVPWF